MLAISCTFIGICLFILGSSGNTLCILVFLRKKFRYRIITPFFIVLLFADSIYLLLRLIKLFYYSQTLFRLHPYVEPTCANSFFVQIYQHATQTWSQILVPLVHSETYIRFSLILMCIMSVQRTAFISRSVKFIVLPNSFHDNHKYKWNFLLIFIAFLIAYMFELAGLTLFCSKTSNPTLSLNWFLYLSKNMENSTSTLLNTTISSENDRICINYAMKYFQRSSATILNKNSICTHEKLVNVLSQYFDQHQRPVVNLIQKIIFFQTGQKISRNEIRRKFHFHECLFPQDPKFFHQYYDFMYSRIFSFNRHTLLVVLGSILPSLITIVSNVTSLFRVRELNRVTSMYILPCRRRTDDTRRILLVITVECLFAIVNSWFSDIILSLIYCKRNISAGDDCPKYLQQNYDLLMLFDMFNSISNIVLHCICGRRFRNELRRMFQSLINVVKHFWRNIWCCYCRIRCQNPQHSERFVTYTARVSRQESSNSSNNCSQPRVHLKIKPSSKSSRRNCCDFQWYVAPRPLSASANCFSNVSKDCLPNDRQAQTMKYQSLTQKSYLTRPSHGVSMKLYYPPPQSNSSTTNKAQLVTNRR